MVLARPAKVEHMPPPPRSFTGFHRHIVTLARSSRIGRGDGAHGLREYIAGMTWRPFVLRWYAISVRRPTRTGMGGT
ncbi:hypothetical protein GCM10022226_55840 [Sphaerisporangium flaviroseum]|uniref:Uncharacterized protein n=1 Tax=Sphaerisporangium flaviroseum TaxID=509199 RepID=A0ABP7IV85_9ACTN